MNKFEILNDLIKAGYLQTAVAVQHGISKTLLSDYVKKQKLKRVAHGIYAYEESWPDIFYLLYLKSKRIIFSFEAALYLHGLIDREPSHLTVTVPNGYNDAHLKKDGIKVIHSKWYTLGASVTKTSYGHEVPVYDRERTICDIIRRKKDIEIQTYQTALKEYMGSKGKNLLNLMRYAKEFKIESLVRTYTEVML